MTSATNTRRARLGTALAALAIGLGTVAAPRPRRCPAERRAAVGNAEPQRRHGHPGSPVGADERRVRRQRRDRRRPGQFADASSMSSARAAAKPRSTPPAPDGRVVYAANVRVGNNLELGRRDAPPGDARSQHPGDPDEQPRAARPAPSPPRRRRPRPSGWSRPMSATARRSSAGCVRRRRCRSTSRSASPRSTARCSSRSASTC